MTYAAYDVSKPDASSQNGTVFAQSTRENVRALRDMLAATGMVQGFAYSVSGGTAEQPAYAYYKRGSEWVRLNLTWGTVGGADGNVTKISYFYSSNSGSNWDNMADLTGNFVMTLTYDSNGNCTATTWGSTP